MVRSIAPNGFEWWGCYWPWLRWKMAWTKGEMDVNISIRWSPSGIPMKCHVWYKQFPWIQTYAKANAYSRFGFRLEKLPFNAFECISISSQQPKETIIGMQIITLRIQCIWYIYQRLPYKSALKSLVNASHAWDPWIRGSVDPSLSCQTYPQSLGLYDEDLRDAGAVDPGVGVEVLLKQGRLGVGVLLGLVPLLADLFEELGDVFVWICADVRINVWERLIRK